MYILGITGSDITQYGAVYIEIAMVYPHSNHIVQFHHASGHVLALSNPLHS